jgi:hypothetical protein
MPQKSLSGCDNAKIHLEASRYENGARLRMKSGGLMPGHKYRACAIVDDPSATFFCSQEFTVAQPFFQFPVSEPVPSPGAYIISRKASAPVAIFGVVDPANPAAGTAVHAQE